MALELKQLDVEHFEPLVGETFRIGDYDTELIKVSRGPETPPRFRTQFSLLFKCPAEFAGEWMIAPVSHPEIGQHDLLVTKIHGWEDEFEIEIVFN